MRITFVLPYAGLQGGVRVIANYADRLQRRGHYVSVVSMPQVIDLRTKAKDLLLGKGVPQPQPSHFDGVGVPHRVLEAIRPVTDEDVPNADVVIATYFTTAVGVMRLSPSKGAKAIFIQNYEVEHGQTNPDLDASWRMPMHKITISKWLVDLARDKFGDNCVSHVPNAVDCERFYSAVRTKAATPTVGLLYNTFSLKGLDTSLAALKQIAAVKRTMTVLSFGAEKPDFRYRLPHRAHFAYRPSQDTIRELYSQCDVWMCGSNVEGFHLPPLEAMACRCPVVSTRVGGPLDIIEDGVNGYLVDVKDARALAKRVLYVLDMPEYRWREMSDAAYRTATRFTMAQATDLFEGALRLAIDRTRRGEFDGLGARR